MNESIASIPHPKAPSNSRAPRGLWITYGMLAVLGLVSPNPLIGLLGTIIGCLITVLLWKPIGPQTFVFILGYQWMQAFAPVVLALLEGDSIEKALGGPQFETATILSQVALLVMALGFKVATRRGMGCGKSEFLRGLRSINRMRLFAAWVIASLLAAVATRIGASSPSIRQALMAVEVWKWAAVMLLFLRWLALGEGAVGAVLVLLVELLTGMLGYFSTFKQVFLILLLAGTGVFSLGGRRSGLLLGVGAVLLVLLGFWQVIKMPYRSFLSRGERTQTVEVSVGERIDWLYSTVTEIDWEMMREGWMDGLRRIGYVEYFGHALTMVPQQVEHTNGLLWKQAVLHPLTPRFLFPDKPAINDSDRTNAYTGVQVAGSEEGTSVSIGYIGESYIDFGKAGMFVALFLWALLIGWCYSTLRRAAPHPVMGSALAAALLLSSVLLIESSNLKLVGSLLSGFLVSFVVVRFLGKALWKWLTAGECETIPSAIGQEEIQSEGDCPPLTDR